MVENEPKTQSSQRALPLDDALVAVLMRASARYAQEKLASVPTMLTAATSR